MDQKVLFGIGLIALAYWWLNPETSVETDISFGPIIDDAPTFTAPDNVFDFRPGGGPGEPSFISRH